MIYKSYKKWSDSLGITPFTKTDFILWILWYIASAYLLEFRTTSEPFGIGISVIVKYATPMILLTIFFYDMNYIKKYFNKFLKVLWIVPYVISIILIFFTVAINTVSLDIYLGMDGFSRVCAVTFYWMLSIALTVLRNKRVWLIYAIGTYLLSLQYIYILRNNCVGYVLSPITYLFMTIGITLLATFISMAITKISLNKRLTTEIL